MSRLQSPPNDVNVANTDQETTAAITVADVANPGSNNTIDPEQQLSNTQKDRLDKAVIRLSSRTTLIQAVLTIPGFAVLLNNSIGYLNQCPIQPLINVFLIVTGCSNLANGIMLAIGFRTANYIKRSSNRSPCARRVLTGSLIGQLVYLLFSIAWLVVGQVWVFGAQTHGFQSTNSTESATYCHPTVFWTGFVTIIVTYAIWLILILVFGGRFLIKRYKTKQGTAPRTDESS
jgi:hypothetical protein